MKPKLSFVLMFLQIFLFVQGKDSFYTIVAPGTIQPNMKYSVSVTLHANDGQATIKVGIVGPTFNDSKTVDLWPSQTEVVHFDIPDKLKDARHMLETEGIQGIIFKNTTDLIYKPREPKIYIQTDKSVYKPGDLVQYRILVLDYNTRPAKLNTAVRLGFKDGVGNFVKEVKDLKFDRGVYSGEFQLSDQPVLGSWIMQVFMGPDEEDKKLEKHFQVDKYVLPKFSVDIDTAKDIAFDEGIVKVTVRSKYTYDKPVKGKATITATTKNGQVKSEKIIDMLGKGQVEFDLVNDLMFEMPAEEDKFGHYMYTYVPPISILAVMTEEQTGNQRNTTATVNVHRSRYNIVVTENVYEYIANKPFLIRAYIKNLDGSPVQNSKQMAKLRMGTQERSNDYEFSSEVDNNGMAVFKVDLPAAYISSIKITYGDKTEYLPAMTGKEDTDTETTDDDGVGPLKLVLKTDNPHLGDDVVVEVKSNKNIPYYVYAIVARGNIIKQEYVKVSDATKSHELKFKPCFDMVPKANLYVYFVLDGDLKFDELTLSFPKEFENKIEITAPKQAEPSEEITLNIKSDPESYVGLLGVDQSVLLLKAGNDLNSNQIMNDLEGYKTLTPLIRGSGKYPGQTSGLVTLTNANYPYNPGNELAEQATIDPFAYTPVRIMPAAGGGKGKKSKKTRTPTKPAHTTPSMLGYDTPSFSQNLFSAPRNNFVENWIFNEENLKNTDENGMASLKKKIPDTITSWVVTGFAMNDKTGFGMVQSPTKIEVFKPFFVSTNLPYSVKRGEIIAIPVVLFNYMDKALDAEITMENTDNEYDFVEVSNEIEEVVVPDKQRVKRVTVPSSDGKSISFMIRPNKVGYVSLKIKAVSALAGDAIDQKLKVEPEGVTKYENEALFITADDDKGKQTLKATIPQDAVLDSEYLEFSVVGDLLGPTIKNIDKLVLLPHGCGEQNMVNFVPNILVLNYLEATKQDASLLSQKAKGYLEVGYQRELTYKHSNGAYSAFGEGYSEPNSWLTAYVARSFIQARKYISVCPNIINEALKYLVSNQLESGQFKQTGRLFHPSHQNEVGFTAFCLLALLEDQEFSQKYKSKVNKGINYLADNIEKEDDTYALAIAALALKKSDNPAFDSLMTKLEGLAKEENGLKWWTKSSKDHSNDIEITAYILEAYSYSEPAGKLIPIVKWLIAQRNSNGGFDSTQDTVVGLQALTKFAEKFVSDSSGTLTISFEAQDDQGQETTKDSISVDKENALQVQTHVLPKSTRQVTLEAKGTGSSLVQLSYRYNLATKDENPGFKVIYKILSGEDSQQLELEICVSYVPGPDDDIKESNMAVMVINLPSGYIADPEKFDRVRSIRTVQRVETEYSDTTVNIYFDGLTADKEVCATITADKSHAVAKQKPAAITVYDYYTPEQRATVYYEVKSSLCDICDQDECGNC